MFCATSDNAPFPAQIRQLCGSCLRSLRAEYTRVFVGSRNRTNSALVFGIVLSYLWLIHWFWLRGVLSEDDKPIVDTKLAGTLEISASQTSNGPGK
jgi:tellurite resistance protein TehA-like permease